MITDRVAELLGVDHTDIDSDGGSGWTRSPTYTSK